MQSEIRRQMWKDTMPAERLQFLSSLISGQQVDFEDIYCEGITKITVEDMRYAKAMGTTIKLLGFQQDTCRKTWRDGRTLHALSGSPAFTM